MQTYGFRGEALSSISHIAKLSITTKTDNELCGYKVSFVDGKPTEKPQKIAANKGTQIVVEDLFYNNPIRKRTLKSPADEYSMITDLVTKYGVHNSNKVAFSLKKSGERIGDVTTFTGWKTLDSIKSLYGSNVAQELIPIEINDEKFKFSLVGYISNSNVSLKKFKFIIFINDRLVECSFMKKAIETTYSSFLSRGSHPFVYLSLKIAYHNIDVNVHPAKSEVHFLHEENICYLITTLINDKLSECDSSKNFIVPKIIPRKNSEDNQVSKSFEQMFKSPAPTAPKTSTTSTSKSSASSSYSGSKGLNKLVVQKPPSKTINSSITAQKTPQKPSTYIRTDSRERKIDEFFASNQSNERVGQEIRLTSVLELRNQVGKNIDRNFQEMLIQSSYVGCPDQLYLLLQFETKLTILNTEHMNRELFYQCYLFSFGNFDCFKLSNPLKIRELASIYLEYKKDTEVEPEQIEHFLISKSEMLDDYFSIKINDEGELITMPILLDGHTPNWAYLPKFVCCLAKEINWQNEKKCFEDIGLILSHFYAKPPSEFENEEQHLKWSKNVELVLYPAYKGKLCPSKNLANQSSLTVIADLNDLYKVFERC